jgi:hypothetical protein
MPLRSRAPEMELAALACRNPKRRFTPQEVTQSAVGSLEHGDAAQFSPSPALLRPRELLHPPPALEFFPYFSE